MRHSELTQEIQATAEQSYNQLDGEWHNWLEVARKYEHKVKAQDRLDIRHTIILELYHARQRDGEPLPILRAYRIASFTIAQYWRQLLKPLIKVCVIDGLPKKPDPSKCGYHDKPLKCRQCPFLALRHIRSLEEEIDIGEGDIIQLKDTIADDNAIDLEAWLDEATWRLGCPMRLVQIARKRLYGLQLTPKEQAYFYHCQARQFKKHQKTLF